MPLRSWRPGVRRCGHARRRGTRVGGRDGAGPGTSGSRRRSLRRAARLGAPGPRCAAGVVHHPGGEDVVVRSAELRRELVSDEQGGKLARNWNCPRGSIRLGGSALTLPVDLPCELDLGIVHVAESHLGPRQGQQLRDPSHQAIRRAGALSRVEDLLWCGRGQGARVVGLAQRTRDPVGDRLQPRLVAIESGRQLS